jgi:hypothetical protein
MGFAFAQSILRWLRVEAHAAGNWDDAALRQPFSKPYVTSAAPSNVIVALAAMLDQN